MAQKNPILESLETNLLSLYPHQDRPKKRPSDNLVSHTPPTKDGSVDTTIYETNDFAGSRQVVSLPFGSFDQGVTGYRNRVFIYRSMARSMEVSRAIEDIVNEAIVMDNTSSEGIVQINLDDVDGMPDSLKKKIADHFDHILKLLNFNRKAQKLFTSWYVDGRLSFEKIIDKNKPKAGLQKIKQLQPENLVPIRRIIKGPDPENPQIEVIKRIEKFYAYTPDQRDSYSHQLGIGGGLGQRRIIFRKNAICDVNSDLYDGDFQVISYLDKAIRPYNQLRSMEDSLVIYRIARAPERRIFYVDTGNLPRAKAEQYIKDIMANYKNKIVYNATTGTIQDAKNVMTIQDDFWLPRSDGKGTEVSTLPGGNNLSDMDDVNYFKENLYRALNVPLSRLQQDTGFQLGRATEITRDEVNFKKFIGKIRTQFSYIFLDLLKTHLILTGTMTSDEWDEVVNDIAFDFENDSFFFEMKQLDIYTERMNVLQVADQFVGKYFSKETIEKEILGRSDEEVKEEQKRMDSEIKDGDVMDPMDIQKAQMGMPPEGMGMDGQDPNAPPDGQPLPAPPQQQPQAPPGNQPPQQS